VLADVQPFKFYLNYTFPELKAQTSQFQILKRILD